MWELSSTPRSPRLARTEDRGVRDAAASLQALLDRARARGVHRAVVLRVGDLHRAVPEVLVALRLPPLAVLFGAHDVGRGVGEALGHHELRVAVDDGRALLRGD